MYRPIRTTVGWLAMSRTCRCIFLERRRTRESENFGTAGTSEPRNRGTLGTPEPMKPTFFPTPADFRAWFKKNHLAVPELLVGFYKKESGRPSITWPDAVDEALCAGWIDGVRRRIDDES